MCAYDASKPVNGSSLVAADIRENFRALKEDDIVEGVAALGIVEGMIGTGAVTEDKIGTGVITSSHLAYAAGDILVISSDAEKIVAGNGTWRLMKSIRIAKSGTLRIKFDCHGEAADRPAYFKVYRNDSPVGTQQAPASATYVTKSEDIAGWSPGDTCQVYSYENAYSCYLQNFRLYTAYYFEESVITA
ncbi:MAG TPA: hypothetical protein VMW09_03405 [Desulfatiglandales bacterium]|nr:hypothetical protein [Desulfatiglandales bacterium]